MSGIHGKIAVSARSIIMMMMNGTVARTASS